MNIEQSLTQRSCTQMQADILYNVLSPDTKLTIQYLKQRYDMGGTPIREALNQLVVMGLVNAVPLKGFWVAPMSSAQLQDIYSNRILIEGHMIALLLTQSDDDWELTSVANAHRMKKLLRSQSPLDLILWMQVSQEWFDGMLSAVASPWLQQARVNLSLHAQRYQYTYLQSSTNRLDVLKAENASAQSLLTSLTDRDTSSAKSSHEAYLQNMMELMMPFYQQREKI
jgi:GntR family transcriptional regulator, carbon starvation induced regulator